MNTNTIENEPEVLNKSDSTRAMCDGLSAGIARRAVNNKSINAVQATKVDGPFYCPKCHSDAIVRKCNIKDDHFAHKANLSLLFGNGESQLHKDCKAEILKDLQEQFPNGNWAMERPINGNQEKGLSDVVPDLSGRIDGKAVVIEVQRSFLNLKTILKRTEEYRKRGVAILWIVPLKEDLPEKNFRPRLFEKFLHSMYYGRIYYWQKGFRARVLPVHYKICYRYIEVSSWFDTDLQEEMVVGGYEKAYKTIKEPIYFDDLIEIWKDFFCENAKEWSHQNENLDVPLRLIYRDNLEKWWGDDNDTSL